MQPDPASYPRHMCCSTKAQSLYCHHVYYYHNTTEWDDKMLTENPIYEGFRWDINGNEYLGPDKRRDMSLPVVVRCCAVNPRRISNGNVTITLYFGGRFIDEGLAVATNLRIANITVSSCGMVKMNHKKPFLIAANSVSSPDSGFKPTLYEYFDCSHLRKELAKLNPRKP